MAFRDQSTALREQLEAAEKQLASLRARNEKLAAGHAPERRGLAVALGVTVVLGVGTVVHLGTQNRGLEAVRRQQEETVGTLRHELDRERAAREDAENGLVIERATQGERAALERDRATSLQADAWRAGASPPPTPAEPSRYFWIADSRGRDDLASGFPCVLELRQTAGVGGVNSCGVEVRCGEEQEIPLVPPRTIDCTARPDGWVNAVDDDGRLRVVLRGRQIGVRDEDDSWSVTLQNERPCE